MNTFKQHGFPASSRFRAEDGWNVFISYIGFFRSSGDFHWEQTSPMYALHIILKGRGVFSRDGRKYVATAGDSFTLFPGSHVTYYDFPESPWEYIWLRLSGADVEKVLATAGITPKRPFRKVAMLEKLESFLHEIGRAYGKNTHPPLFPMTSACRCLDMISGVGLRPSSQSNRCKEISDSFISIVESRLEKAPSIGAIVDLMKIDRTTLFRVFIREKGISPKRFLENRRIERAKRLLAETGLSVKELSDECGFAHPGQFCAVFRKNTGRTPAKWRIG